METIKSQVLHDLEKCFNEAKSEGRGYLIPLTSDTIIHMPEHT